MRQRREKKREVQTERENEGKEGEGKKERKRKKEQRNSSRVIDSFINKNDIGPSSWCCGQILSPGTIELTMAR